MLLDKATTPGVAGDKAAATSQALHHARQVFPRALQACDPPKLLLHNDCCPAGWPSPATLLVTPVEVLDQHCSSPALLEPFLLIVTSEFALDEDGRLGHLFVKCILQGTQKERDNNNGSQKSSELRR